LGVVPDYLPGSLTRSLRGSLGTPPELRRGPFAFHEEWLDQKGVWMSGAALDAYATRLAQTLPEVRGRIAEAAAAANRRGEDIRLVAVTKGHPVAAIQAALAIGLTDLGENRIDELEEKRAALPTAAARWHFIGHVQSRKTERVVAASDLVHSIDSLKLAERISRAGEARGEPVSVLVQVNTSGEGAKGGFEGPSVLDDVQQVAELPGLRALGLMTMAPFVEDEAILRGTFAGLRSVSERVRAVTSRLGPELSMGMTNDLEIAIREGSTMVRIGTALFGERDRV
jgi:pyridoxal phosphate enzyme (YggS family)